MLGMAVEAEREKRIYWLLLNHKARRLFFTFVSFLNFYVYYTKFLMHCQEISLVLFKIISQHLVGLLLPPYRWWTSLKGRLVSVDRLC